MIDRSDVRLLFTSLIHSYISIIFHLILILDTTNLISSSATANALTTVTQGTTINPLCFHLFYDFYFFGHSRSTTSSNEIYANRTFVLVIHKSQLLKFHQLPSWLNVDDDNILGDKHDLLYSFLKCLPTRRSIRARFFNVD